jgi:thioredoxin reductase (NADPH)
MITANSLRKTKLFASLNQQELEVLASGAADIRLKPGEWLIREGERADFFVVLEGSLQLKKELMGREMSFSEFTAGEFYGEISALFGLPTLSSLQAKSICRVARFSAGELQRLVQAPTECGRLIRSTIKERLDSTPEHLMRLPVARVQLNGDDRKCEGDDLRVFLRLNHIPYTSLPSKARLHGRDAADTRTVLVDDVRLEEVTPRAVAQALGIATTPSKKEYDVVVVGGGPAGLASAVYGASEGLRVLLIERTAMGGQAGTSSRIENYLGFPSGISGDELSERAVKQAHRLGAELVLTRTVESIERTPDGRYTVRLDGMESVCSKTIIVATGVHWRALKVPGMARLNGKGVFHGTATLDPSAVTGKKVFIVGGGNSAGQSAVFLSHYAHSVTILIRRASLTATMSQYLIEQLESKGNISVETSTELTSVCGTRQLTKIRTVNRDHESIERSADLLQVMIGADATTDWLPPALECDEHGFICTGSDITDFSSWEVKRKPFLLETNLPGLFCAGDVRSGSVKRVSSAAGEGSVAISMVHRALAYHPQ